MKQNTLRTLIFLFTCFYLQPYAVASLVAKDKDAMVVSAHHLATKAGVEVLKQGGNAVDAAVAVGYALSVVYQQGGGLGGGGFMLIRFADGKETFFNFREKAPKAISPDLFLDAQGKIKEANLSGGYLSGAVTNGYLIAGIPGTVLGFNTALKKYGHLSLSQVMAPAIQLAKKGYPLTENDVIALTAGTLDFQHEPNVAAILLDHNKPYQVGQTLVQKNLGSTLQQIADHGSDAFYRGPITAEVIKASEKNGGIMTKQDFDEYTVKEIKPLHCQYRGYDIITTPPPGSGMTVCEILQIVQGYPLRTFGYNTVKSTHYNVEAMRYAYADRNYYLSDPDFNTIPVETLISEKHANTIRQHISDDTASPSSQITVTSSQLEGHNTTSYAVVDAQGNAVSVTFTLNDYFGSKVIPGNTGFFLNNQLSDFTIKQGVPDPYGLVSESQRNLIGPGKRPASSMSPTIVTKNNRFFMATGAPGGSTIPTQIVEVIENVIDYQLPLEQAVNAPRYHMQWLPDVIFAEESTFTRDQLSALSLMGYAFKLSSPWDTPHWGIVAAILAANGTLEGVMDKRQPSGAAMGAGVIDTQ